MRSCCSPYEAIKKRKDLGGGGSSPVQEGVPKGVELPERLFGVHHQSIARDGALVLTVHHRYEAVGGGLRSYPHPGEVLLQQIPWFEKADGEKNDKLSQLFERVDLQSSPLLKLHSLAHA